MSYSKEVIQRCEKPLNTGSLDKDDPCVGTGLVGAPACGDVLKLQIRVNQKGIIEEVKFKAFGCGSLISSSSLSSEMLEGKTLEQAQAISNLEIASHLKLPPIKVHCSLLAEEAIQAAIADYQSKHKLTKSKG